MLHQPRHKHQGRVTESTRPDPNRPEGWHRAGTAQGLGPGAGFGLGPILPAPTATRIPALNPHVSPQEGTPRLRGAVLAGALQLSIQAAERKRCRPGGSSRALRCAQAFPGFCSTLRKSRHAAMFIQRLFK